MKGFAFALILLAPPAAAQEMRAKDAARDADFYASFGCGMRIALEQGTPENVAVL